MNSAPNGPESVEVSKQEVIDAYKKFIDQGIVSPDDLDLSDPEVIEADNLYRRWVEQRQRMSKGNKQAEHEFNFEQTAFYFDAGFRDPNYLNEVLSWLFLDSDDIGKDANDPTITNLRGRYAKKMIEIRAVLKKD